MILLCKDLNTNKISEMIYAVKNNIKQKSICINCNKNDVFFISHKLGYSRFCCQKCASQYIMLNISDKTKEKIKNKYKDQNKKYIANQKRYKTNLEKYGYISPNKGKASKVVKSFYEKEKEKYDNIVELYTKDEVNELLNSEEYYYKQYFGKGKMRALKSKNLKLYKSIIELTKEFVPRIPHYNFSASLLIAAELNFDVSKNLCDCGKTILYDVDNLIIKKNGICKFCDRKNQRILYRKL